MLQDTGQVTETFCPTTRFIMFKVKDEKKGNFGKGQTFAISFFVTLTQLYAPLSLFMLNLI